MHEHCVPFIKIMVHSIAVNEISNLNYAVEFKIFIICIHYALGYISGM